ncbi:Z1 domain-containing protein [Herpetosiphon llansteffanensis]|uniref:Z1 domain-containing protein n=1 Tax=Herpetosiphon llansteffanensis TaxID=2094568 RepID=UPI000D7CBDC0|nr:Z1 domain-containing protein [Herpetosiphon llansteffanensis]
MTYSVKIKEAEKLLSQVILSRGDYLSSQDIITIVEQFRPVFQDTYYQFKSEDFNILIRSLETQYFTTMGAGVSLIDLDIPHDEEWYRKHQISWDYAEDYEKYLITQGWPTRVIGSMGSVTNRILGLLQDPQKDGDWERRGLVIGHVQSGKTSNYIGLISKAADAGYKFIIVIAGIHNNLRTQTQERIDVGFIGRDSKNNNRIGVGQLRPNRSMPVTVTTTESDFNKALANRFGMELKSLNNTFILVIKKNVSTLGSLYNWLKELNVRQGIEKISDIPMLLIDDEADNASINTNKPEIDPTRTNKEIRRILNLFKKRCYIGYTATPFANVFINPDNKNDMLGNDLFPAHFIHCLDAPTNYFGSEKIFSGDDSIDNIIIRKIDDVDNHISIRHNKYDSIQSLPESLKKAINCFILSRTIRNIRGDKNKHCSMMVNVSRFVSIQQEFKYLIKEYIEKLQNAIRFNYKLPIEKSLKDELIQQLFKNFQEEYINSETEWMDILDELNEAASLIKILLVNSKSDEALNYTTYTNQGDGLTVIVIGGLSLSRGLTIEGLTISYIYRNSKMYDTLMQMGRWFGYREGYEDLCRIYMSDISYGWYCHISEATEELRMQVKRMSREQKKPSDFGLYVRAHPDTLIVTALNKMRYAENRSFHISYDGKLMETHILPASIDKNESNRSFFKSFFDILSQSSAPYIEATNSLLFKDINWEDIQNFILSFRFHNDLSDLQENIPKFIKEISDIYPYWDVAFRSLSGKEPEIGYMIAAQERDIGHDTSGQPRKPSSENGWYTGNKNRFSGNSMFKIGLDDNQIMRAQGLAAEASRKNPIFSDYTNVRGKPLLLLHLLNLIDRKKDDQVIQSLVPAISLSFPNSNDVRTIKYVVNSVWLKQFEENQYDSSSEEDDYDINI